MLKDQHINPFVSNYFKKYSDLELASKLGHVEIVRLMINHNNKETFEDYPRTLQIAATYGHLDIVKFLLENKKIAKPYAIQRAFKEAVLSGHSEIVSFLIDNPNVDPIIHQSFGKRKNRQLLI